MARTDDPDLRALRRMLTTKDAKAGLRYLDKFYTPRLPAFQKPVGDAPIDPFAAAVRDGQRDVIQFLESQHQVPQNENE
jgi:hypothetical protein